MALNIVNCKKCGRIFQQVGSRRICPDCERALEDKFEEERDYIREHPDVSIMEVSREKEVSVEQLKQWVREERLLFTNAEGSGIECVMCGVPIATGKYCARCKEKIAHNLGAAYEKPKVTMTKPQQASTKGKMRFINNEKE